ncbi:MAG: AI-2E family transporter [Acidobacteria bacterium]|nr:AI-2E family transporter [Acidobacteriota bacterium]
MNASDRDVRIITICLLILTVFATGVVLSELRAVLVPFVLALFITMGLAPLIHVQIVRLQFPRTVAIMTSISVAMLVLVLAGIITSVTVAGMIQNARQYQQQISLFVANALESLPLDEWGIDESQLVGLVPAQVGGAVVGVGNAVIDILSNGILVVVFVIFLLIGRTAAGPRGSTWNEVETRVQRYLGIKFLVSLVTGFSVGFVLQVLGVPFALMFGLMSFMLNFIPSVGSIVATLLPLPVVMVDPSLSSTTAVLAIVVPGAIQMTMGNFIEPKIYGESLGLHPVVTLMSLVLWGTLWGVVGMFLAAPLAAIIQIFLGRLEHTRPFAEAMAGRLDPLLGDD